jgi:hypothetical protein
MPSCFQHQLLVISSRGPLNPQFIKKYYRQNNPLAGSQYYHLAAILDAIRQNNPK